MKGKKIDTEFISQFISNCISRNIFTPENILQEALNEISFIDENIKEVENLKKRRSKLLDVVSKFDVKIASSNLDDKNILSLYEIKDHNLSKLICNSIKKYNVNMNDTIIFISSFKIYSEEDIIFCIKQLLRNKIIDRQDQLLLKGQKFNDYYKYILRDL